MVPLLLGVLVTTQHYIATQRLDDMESSHTAVGWYEVINYSEKLPNKRSLSEIEIYICFFSDMKNKNRVKNFMKIANLFIHKMKYNSSSIILTQEKNNHEQHKNDEGLF